jgi:protein-S-isoprenylcysteine O-methyltransferase Ste14
MAVELFAMTGILQVAATVYFVAFWLGFAFWKRHPAATYTMMFSTFAALAAIVWWQRDDVLAWRADIPGWAQAIGWVWLAAIFVIGWIADRQIGFRVRSFAPFFDGGTIALRTTGAYGVVRHPIYAAGIGWQLGVLLVTGYAAVGVATLVFGLGAVWFTRQEERRLVEVLEDPGAYAPYRARVPALLPWPRPRARRAR